MRILYAKVFGIGNAICAIPAIKALRSLGHQVDILVGTLPDDFGSRIILGYPSVRGEGQIFTNSAPLDIEYDLAILAIPFDGRWQNGTHFRAKELMDGRTRPDPSTTGLVSWERHEVSYQMDYAYSLGFQDPVPDCSFLGTPHSDENRIFVGMGYKKDAAGFWKVKHFGNEKFAKLIQLLLQDPKVKVIATGDAMDMQMSLKPVYQMVQDPRFIPMFTSLPAAFELLGQCGTYVGNDTGMMHVAASMDKNVVAYFNIEGAIRKSQPWCKRFSVFDGTAWPVSPEDMYEAVQELRNASR